MKLKPLLTFNGNAQEALTFYLDVFNGTIGEHHLYGEYQEFKDSEDYQKRIIHSDLNFGGCTISLNDAMPNTSTTFGELGHNITVFCNNETELKNIFSKLSVAGNIKCDICTPCYAKLYAEVIDKFGIYWALIIE